MPQFCRLRHEIVIVCFYSDCSIVQSTFPLISLCVCVCNRFFLLLGHFAEASWPPPQGGQNTLQSVMQETQDLGMFFLACYVFPSMLEY